MSTAVVETERPELFAVQETLPADRHPALVYLAQLSPGSRRVQRAALDTIAGLLTGGAADAESLPWHLLRYQHTAAIRSALAERYAPATANRMLSALRGAIKEAWRLGLMSAEESQRAADLKAVNGDRLPAGRALRTGEIRALFQHCAEDPRHARGARDAALLAILYGAGLRRAEAAALELGAYDPEGGTLRVRGKGNKERVAHLGAGGTAAVDAWIKIRGDAPGALVCPVSQRGEVEIRHMTGQSIRDALDRRARRAGVSGFSPHDARRTFISDLLDAGADLSVVQQLAGHASPTTTARYDRRGERAKARAAGLLHVPFIDTASS